MFTNVIASPKQALFTRYSYMDGTGDTDTCAVDLVYVNLG